MNAEVQIVDLGRGPQLSTSRITVMDVFYYLHRGRDWPIVHKAMPSLTREEYDVIVAYVDQHRHELVEEDRYVEECIQQGIAEQRIKGLQHEIDSCVPVEERAARLKEKLRRRLAEQVEKNGGLHPH